MTDRITAYLVTLDGPTREDDAESTLAAIRQLRGVVAVQPVTRDGLTEQATITRRDIAWHRAIRDLLRSGPMNTGEES